MELTFPQRIQAILSGSIKIPEQPKQPLPPPLRPPVIEGSYNGFTLAHWRNSPERIRAAQALFRESYFRDMLAVLSNARPYVKVDEKLTDTQAQVELGRHIGYNELFTLLLSLPISPDAPPVEIEADYGADVSAEPLD